MTYIYLKNFFKKTYLIATLLFLGVFSIYSFTSTPQAVGLHDSDFFIYVSSIGGTLPSPGYPLLNLIFYISSNILGDFLGVAFSLHLVNAFFMALSSSIIFLILQKLYYYYYSDSDFVLVSKEFESVFISIFTTLILSLSKYIWRYSVFTERFSLSVLLMSLVLYFFIEILINNSKANKFSLVGLLLSLGLGISHQWIFVGVAIASLVLLRKELINFPKPKIIQGMAALISGIFLPLSYLFITSNNPVEYTKIINPSIENLFTYISTDYLGDGFARGKNLESILETANLETVISNLFSILKILLSSFGYWVVLILPLVLIFRRPKKLPNLSYGLIGLLLGLGVVLGLVFDWRANLLDYPELLPQILILHPILAILLWFGFKELITRIGNAGVILTQPQKLYALILLIMILTLGLIGYTRFDDVYLNNKVLAGPIAKHTLESIEDNSLLACFTEFSCYALIYQQKVEGINSNSIILPYFHLPNEYYFEHNDLQTFDYGSYPMVIFDMLTSQRYQRPIYTVDMFEEYFAFMGIDYGFFYSIPYGYYNQLVSNQVEAFPETDLGFAKNLTNTQIASWDITLQKNKLETVKRHLFNASIYMKSNQRQLAQREVNLATTMAYGLNPQTSKEISDIRQNIESIQPRSFFELGKKSETPEYVLEQIEELLQRGLVGRALSIARGAMTLDHTHIESRLKYANILEITQASESAVIEYKNVLKLDSENPTAKERIEYQENIGQ